mgnify:CR=1 FL=1
MSHWIEIGALKAKVDAVRASGLRVTGFQVLRDAERSLAVRALVKLPTGDVDKLTGSQGTDFATWLDYTDRELLARFHLSMTGAIGLMVLGDGDLLDLAVERCDERSSEIVGHRPLRLGALEVHQDRRGFGMADPDRQKQVGVLRLQQHDRLLADQIEAHAIDGHLAHRPRRQCIPECRVSGTDVGTGAWGAEGNPGPDADGGAENEQEQPECAGHVRECQDLACHREDHGRAREQTCESTVPGHARSVSGQTPRASPVRGLFGPEDTEKGGSREP